MTELFAQINEIRRITQLPGELHQAAEEYLLLFFNQRCKLPFSKSDTSFNKFLANMVKDTIATVAPEQAALLKDGLNIQSEETHHFFTGICFLKTEFINFFYFADLDMGALIFCRFSNHFRYVPLSMRNLQKGEVPDLKEMTTDRLIAMMKNMPGGGKPEDVEMAEKIQRLRSITRTAKEISEAFSYFLDLTEQYPDFMNDGKHGQSDNVVEIIGYSFGKILGKEGFMVMDQVMSINLPQYSLTHGSCICLDHMIVFYYFEDMGMGVLAASGGRKKTSFLRITAIPFGKAAKNPYSPPRPGKIHMN
jgi:hypothetical protein